MTTRQNFSRQTERGKWFAAEVAQVIMESPSFRGFMRELMLEMQVTQDELNRVKVVREFLAECGAKGIEPWVNRQGTLRFRNEYKMDVEMKETLRICRTDITRRVKLEQEVSERVERRLKATKTA